MGYSPWGCTELDTTEQALMHAHRIYIKSFVSNCVKMLGQEYQKQRRLAFCKDVRSDLRHRRRRWRSQHDGIKGAVSRLAVWKVAKMSDTMKIEKQLLNLVIMPLLT